MLTTRKTVRSPFYSARGTINGRQVERSTGVKTEAAAKRKCKQIEAKILAEDAAIVAQRAADIIAEGQLTVRKACEAYREARRDGRFLEPIIQYFGDRPVSEIKNLDMRQAATALFPTAQPSTIRRNLYTPMKAVINMAADDDLCAPARFKSPTGGSTRLQFFTPQQADDLITQMAGEQNAYLPALVTGLFGQGMRMGEALTLDGTDVNLELRYAVLRDTKNGEERIISLTNRTIAAWARLPTLGEPGALFRRLNGSEFPVGINRGGQIKKPFVRAVEAIGLNPDLFTPHVCRHSWATWYYDQTKDVLALKAQGGWKSGEYQRYTKMTAVGIGEAARQLGWDFTTKGAPEIRDSRKLGEI